MKPLLYLVLFSITALAHADSKPPLSLVEAANIAQAKLDSLDLGPEFFLRSVYLQPEKDNTPEHYIARFEPTKVAQRHIADDSATIPPVILKQIQILMDGSASIIEKELDTKKAIITRPKN